MFSSLNKGKTMFFLLFSLLIASKGVRNKYFSGKSDEVVIELGLYFVLICEFRFDFRKDKSFVLESRVELLIACVDIMVIEIFSDIAFGFYVIEY
jgi:hypothetical protein